MNTRQFVSVFVLIIVGTLTAKAQEDVSLEIITNHPTNTVYLDNPIEVIFYADAGPHELAAITFVVEATYTNGLSLGTIVEGENLLFSPSAYSVFQATDINSNYGAVEVPDTIHFGAFSFGGDNWTGADWFVKITFEPQDTGTIFFNRIAVLPGGSETAALNPDAQELPYNWSAEPIVVANCPYVSGDLTGNGVVTTADIIRLVIYLFKSGAPPQPDDLIADANCDRVVTVADIMVLVNYQGRGGPPPCCSVSE